MRIFWTINFIIISKSNVLLTALWMSQPTHFIGEFVFRENGNSIELLNYAILITNAKLLQFSFHLIDGFHLTKFREHYQEDVP